MFRFRRHLLTPRATALWFWLSGCRITALTFAIRLLRFSARKRASGVDETSTTALAEEYIGLTDLRRRLAPLSWMATAS